MVKSEPAPTSENGQLPEAPEESDVSQTVRIGRKDMIRDEMERLIERARKNRYGHRDATMILVMYRLCSLFFQFPGLVLRKQVRLVTETGSHPWGIGCDTEIVSISVASDCTALPSPSIFV